MNKITAFLIVLILASCKSKAPLLTSNKDKSQNKIEDCFKTTKAFKTLNIRSSVLFTDNKTSQRLTAEIKIKKDEKILISLKFLGITMAKILATPTSVSYYEKVNGTYFEGDFQLISKWLGADLNFTLFQNMIIGDALADLNTEKFTVVSENEKTVLTFDDTNGLTKSIGMNLDKCMVETTSITELASQKTMQLQYSNPQLFMNYAIPTTLEITALQNGKTAKIDLKYENIDIDTNISFPYAVPNGYAKKSFN
jgi:Domain of unknown function (DUF4292)